MKVITAVLLACLPSLGAADGFLRVLNDDAVTAALADRTLVFDAYTLQHFRADGSTQYFTDRMSEGRWAARGGQYCSTWPPSDRWDCYDIQIGGDVVRFIGSDRSVSEGTYRE
jgi:hypothetical protein